MLQSYKIPPPAKYCAYIFEVVPKVPRFVKTLKL